MASSHALQDVLLDEAVCSDLTACSNTELEEEQSKKGRPMTGLESPLLEFRGLYFMYFFTGVGKLYSPTEHGDKGD